MDTVWARHPGGDEMSYHFLLLMVTLFIHGKSFSKCYKMIKDQLIIPN